MDLMHRSGTADRAIQRRRLSVDAATDVDKNRATGYDIVKLFTGSIVSPDHITPMQGHTPLEYARSGKPNLYFMTQ
jgi:hypothetical protein